MIAVFEQLLPAVRRRAVTALQVPRSRTVFIVRVQAPAELATDAIRSRMPTPLAMRVPLSEEPRPDGWADIGCGNRAAAELAFAAVRRLWPGYRVVLATEEQPCDR